MKIDNILQIFVVKEKRFFPLFTQSAENIVKAAEFLVQQTKTEDPDERRMIAHRIKECETAGDTVTHKIEAEAIDAFVTPFERDDIHALAEAMDSFLDSIRDSSKKIAIYQPKQTNEKLIEIAIYIKKAADLVLEATGKFDNMRKETKTLSGICDKIKEVEHIVDDLFEAYMAALFTNEKDAIELTKKKNIVQALEDTSDIAKKVSSTLRSIVVKMG